MIELPRWPGSSWAERRLEPTWTSTLDDAAAAAGVPRGRGRLAGAVLVLARRHLTGPMHVRITDGLGVHSMAIDRAATLSLPLLWDALRTTIPRTGGLMLSTIGNDDAAIIVEEERVIVSSSTAPCEHLADRIHTATRALALGVPPLRAATLDAPTVEALGVLGRGRSHPTPPGRTVLDRLDAVFSAHSDRHALNGVNGCLTYRELDRYTATLAATLQDAGVGPGSVVMVHMHAGSAQIIALLGVLRAGGAYLPVDPTYPDARIAELVSQVPCSLVFTDSRSPVDIQAWTIDLGSLATQRPRRPRSRPTPSDLAYVIFTSGSTGVPRAILQTHRCLNNYIDWQVEDAGLGYGRRVLQHAALSFDVSIQEILWCLGSAGTLVLTDPHRRHDASWVRAHMAAQRVEVADFPFSFIEALCSLPGGLEEVPSLQILISAGEPLRITPALVQRIEAGLEIHDHYGPAENHMLTSHRITRGLGNIEPHPPIGSPIRNVEVLLIDDLGELVPPGAVGEICAAGVGVARGYACPAQTAQRFVPHATRPSERMFRTGDIGCWRPDGTLELHGRIDDLVKVRGKRVELAEVEARLSQHPQVHQVAVVLHDRQLVAVLGRSPHARADALRQHLGPQLPAYMIPSRWLELQELPRSPNGKLDRRRLPGNARPLPRDTPGEQPEAPLDVRLGALIAKVLHIAPPALDDDLFELGLDSLTATTLAVAAQRELGLDLSLPTLYDAPSLRALRPRLRAATPAQITPVDDAPDHPPTPAQEGLWAFAQVAGPGAAALQFAEVLPLSASPSEVRAAVDALCTVHESLRTTLSWRRDRVRQVVHPHLDVQWTEVEGDHSAALELATEWVGRAIDLGKTAPHRPGLVIDDNVVWLVWMFHHVAVDAWAVDLLLADLHRLLRGAPVVPPSLRMRDIAAWQRSWLTTEPALSHLRGRASLLSGYPPSPRRRSLTGGHIDATIRRPAALDRTARAHDGSPFMVLLAAFCIVLHEHLGSCPAVATTLSGRGVPGLDGVVGMLANALPLAVQVRSSDSAASVIRRARKEVLEASTQEMLPYATLLERHPGVPALAFGIQLLAPARFPTTTVWAGHARYDLWMAGREATADGVAVLAFKVERSERFPPGTVLQILDRLEAVLHGLVESPDRSVEDLCRC